MAGCASVGTRATAALLYVGQGDTRTLIKRGSSFRFNGLAKPARMRKRSGAGSAPGRPGERPPRLGIDEPPAPN